MKVSELFELSMNVGSLDSMATSFALSQEDTWRKGDHIGDIEDFKVLKFDKYYSVWKNNVLVSSLSVSPKDDLFIVDHLWTRKSFRGQKILSKFLWFLKTRCGFSKILLGDIHSDDTRSVITHGLSRFKKSWVKNGEIKPFDKETTDDFYSYANPTGWQLLLENDGDFSSWPKFAGGDCFRDIFEWQIE